MNENQIVLVNDEYTQLKILAGLVEKAGFEAAVFTSAEQALVEMDPDRPPALIVTDLYMPGIDGWRFCRLLRSAEYQAFNNVPVFVVSATFAGDVPERIASELGVEAFLAAPVNGETFISRIREILSGNVKRPRLQALIVEDGKTFAGVLKKAFSAEGYLVDIAGTLKEAAEAFERGAYDIAVIDYHLPDGTGDVLLDRFRAGRPDCACLMMTTDPGPELALDWMKRGAAAYLQKPFEPSYLLELCAKARRERLLLRAQDLLEVRTMELRESEEKYRRIFENSIAGFYRSTPDGRFLDANPALARMLGYDSAEDLISSVSDIAKQIYSNGEDREQNKDAFRHRGHVDNFELKARRRNGAEIWLSDSGRAYYDEAGEVAYYEGVVVDITRRKQVEQALYARGRYLHTILQTTVDGFMVVDVEGNIVEVNDAYCSMSGYSRSELLSKKINHVDSLESREETASRIKRVMQEGSALFRSVHRRKDGGSLPVEVSVTFMPGHGGRFISFFRDLTEREKQQERIEILGRMLDEAPASITIHDDSGRFFYANRKTLELHGYKDEDEFLEVNLHDLDVPESAEMLAERFRLIEEEGEANFEVSHHRKNGSIFPLEVLAKKIQWHGQSAVLSIATDISERRRVEEEKKKLQSQLHRAQRMESVGRLAGGIAHDFNNMLGIIIGHTEMALASLPPDDPLGKDLDEIRKAAGRSADLVRQLLAFARRQTIAPKVLDLNKTVEKMLQMLSRLIGEDIDLAWLPGEDLWPVRLDSSQLDQILANLCVNARDAIADIGKITIETQNAVLDESYCAGRAGCIPGEYVMLAVSDDGTGMEEKVLENIFDPFFTTKEVGKGTGLGLATVYGIVKQNEGFINVYSEPGEGTTFRIYLPRHGEKAGEERNAVKPRQPARGDETVLVVEDESMLLDMSKTVLERFGYRVLPAGSPDDALKLAEDCTEKIDLLMTDVVMPEMNGRDLADKLHSLHPQMKVLFMSGYTANVIAHHGVLDKGVYFIQKPFSVKDLTAKVREVLES